MKIFSLRSKFFYMLTISSLVIPNCYAAKQQDVQKNVETLLSTNSCEKCDLSGADLSLSFLHGKGKQNLKNANLKGANLTNAKFVGTDLEGAVFTSANCVETNFTVANLNGAGFYKASLEEANFTYANLTGASLILAQGTDVNFTRADLTNANLVGAALSTPILNNTNFNMAKMDGIKLEYIVIDTSDFSNASLTDADFSGSSITNSTFDKTNLEGAHLTHVTISGGSFKKANLDSADLSGSSISGADFSGAKITNQTKYTGLAINQVNFSDTYLKSFGGKDMFVLQIKGCSYEVPDKLPKPIKDALIKHNVLSEKAINAWGTAGMVSAAASWGPTVWGGLMHYQAIVASFCSQ